MAFGKHTSGAGGTLLLIGLLAAAVVGGAAIAAAVQRTPALSWLAVSRSFGFGAGTPVTFDLSVLRLTLGLEIRLSVAQALCLVGAALLYRRFR